jgi:Txe/YoeB family toxin of Txe-Axe toxin-antitoxin module
MEKIKDLKTKNSKLQKPLQMKSTIIFGDEKLKDEFEKLKSSNTEDVQLYKRLNEAFAVLENNAFAGIQIPKRLIPREYKTRFGELDNLWKYNLPKAWRLIYTVKRDQVIILSVVLEWMSHKDYEKRFKY